MTNSKNIEVSVKQRLLNKARSDQRPFRVNLRNKEMEILRANYDINYQE